MPFLKNPFTKDKPQAAEPARRISSAPGQSQEEQDENRRRMEAELNASRAARTGKQEG